MGHHSHSHEGQAKGPWTHIPLLLLKEKKRSIEKEKGSHSSTASSKVAIAACQSLVNAKTRRSSLTTENAVEDRETTQPVLSHLRLRTLAK